MSFRKWSEDLKKKLYLQYLLVIKDISEELTKILQDLEDFYTENVDKVEGKKNSFDNILVIAKIKVYQELFIGLNN